MVVAPLLPFVLDAVHRHDDPVEAQAADGGLGLPGADGAGLHAGNGAQALHERPGEIVLDIVPADVDAVQGHVHQFPALRFSVHGGGVQNFGGVLYLKQHDGSQDGCNHILSCWYC